jgi:hypothetical protein
MLGPLILIWGGGLLALVDVLFWDIIGKFLMIMVELHSSIDLVLINF